MFAHKISNKSYDLSLHIYQFLINKLDWTTRTRDPGAIVDDRLTFSDHIMSIVHKSNVRAYLICKCFVTCDRDLLAKASYTGTYIRPLLEYCTVVWSHHHTGLANRIESVQRNFTKKIQGLLHMHYSDRLHASVLESHVKFDFLLQNFSRLS